LPRSDEQGSDYWRDIGAVLQEDFDFPVEWYAPHCAWQEAESLEHFTNVVAQLGFHTNELSSRPEKSTTTAAVERFHVNRPDPAGANDLSQSFRVVLIRPVELHLEGGAGVVNVETNDFESQSAKFMHEPGPSRQFRSQCGVISCTSAHRSGDLFRRRGALATP
jgi:hypothetical protein